MLYSVGAATDLAINAADHLTPMDAGAVEALRVLAAKIDTEQALREQALKHAESHDEKPPAVDNVSVPTYLKYCESLGLTPAGRIRLAPKLKEEPGGNTVTQLRSRYGRTGSTA